MGSRKRSNNNQKTVVEEQQTVETVETSQDTVSEDVVVEEDTPVETTVETPEVTQEETLQTEAPAETPVETPQETPKPEEKKEEETPVEKKTTDKKKKPIDISTNIEIRYAATFSNKRIATVRSMPLYTVIYTYIHNRSAFLGLVDASQLEEIFNYILGNPVTIEGVKMSDQLKKDLYLKIKSDTDYVKIKWGSK